MSAASPLRAGPILLLMGKDWIVGSRFLIPIVPFYLLYGVTTLVALRDTAILYVLVSLAFTAVLAFGSTVLEDVQATDALLLSLPATRADVVGARYGTVLAATLGGFLVFFCFGGLLSLFFPCEMRFSAAMFVAGLAGFLLVMGFVAAVFLPLYFRFGVVRGGVGFTVLFIAFNALLSGILGILGVTPAEAAVALVKGLAALVLALGSAGATAVLGLVWLAALVLSFRLSLRLYRRRDF